MSGYLATSLLNTIRDSFKLNVGEVQYVTPGGEQLWQVWAVSNSGERWIAAAPDYYDAAVLLAELMGFEVHGRL